MAAITNSTSTDDHAEKVFAIPEIMESILLMLDDRDPHDSKNFSSAIMDLFVLQRVNKTFKAAIDGSIKLQRVMMLAHDSEDAPERRFGLEFLLNGPLGHDRFHPAMPCYSEYSMRGGRRKVRLNWNHFDLGPVDEDQSEGYMGCSCLVPDYVDELHDSMRALTRAALKEHFHSGASWRRMKLSFKLEEIEIRMTTWTRKNNGDAGAYSLICVLSSNDILGALFDTVQQVLTKSEVELDEMQDRIDSIVGEVHDVRDRGTEECGLQSLEKLRIRKSEHDKLGDCGVSRGKCMFCCAAHADESIGDILRGHIRGRPATSGLSLRPE